MSRRAVWSDHARRVRPSILENTTMGKSNFARRGITLALASAVQNNRSRDVPRFGGKWKGAFHRNRDRPPISTAGSQPVRLADSQPKETTHA
jgi:hypothetical protein